MNSFLTALQGIAGSAALVSVLSITLLFTTAKDDQPLLSGWANHSSSLVGDDSSLIHDVQQNDFLQDLSRVLGPIESMPEHQWPSVRGVMFLPMVISDGKLLCRRNLKEKMNDPDLAFEDLVYRRMRKVVELIHAALDMDTGGRDSPNETLPVIWFNSDQNGCNVNQGVDGFGYPRFTWSVPSPKYAETHGTGWCNAIAAPTYEVWATVHDRKSKWIKVGNSNSEKYPWSSKINKAVWRGTSTGNPVTGKSLKEIPRGRLVQKSIENPALIDAAFVRLNQKFQGREHELANETILSDRIPFDEQMKYKAIIDIDGNNWSSRFPKLLCTNSVVIKIDPDFIEYFYDQLEPMQHYVPASHENITNVVAYVLDANNEDEMKRIVDNANSWCKSKMTEKHVVKDMMNQLQKYENALDEYFSERNQDRSMIMESLLGNSSRILNVTVTDLVECY